MLSKVQTKLPEAPALKDSGLGQSVGPAASGLRFAQDPTDIFTAIGRPLPEMTDALAAASAQGDPAPTAAPREVGMRVYWNLKPGQYPPGTGGARAPEITIPARVDGQPMQIGGAPGEAQTSSFGQTTPASRGIARFEQTAVLRRAQEAGLITEAAMEQLLRMPVGEERTSMVDGLQRQLNRDQEQRQRSERIRSQSARASILKEASLLGQDPRQLHEAAGWSGQEEKAALARVERESIRISVAVLKRAAELGTVTKEEFAWLRETRDREARAQRLSELNKLNEALQRQDEILKASSLSQPDKQAVRAVQPPAERARRLLQIEELAEAPEWR